MSRCFSCLSSFKAARRGRDPPLGKGIDSQAASLPEEGMEPEPAEGRNPAAVARVRRAAKPRLPRFGPMGTMENRVVHVWVVCFAPHLPSHGCLSHRF